MTDDKLAILQKMPAAIVPRAIAAFFDSRFSDDGLFSPSHPLLETQGNGKPANLMFFEFTVSLGTEVEVSDILDAYNRTTFPGPQRLIQAHRTPRWFGAVSFFEFIPNDLPQRRLSLVHSVGGSEAVARAVASMYDLQRGLWRQSFLSSDDRFSPIHEMYVRNTRITNDRYAMYVSDDAVFASA